MMLKLGFFIFTCLILSTQNRPVEVNPEEGMLGI